MLANVLLIASIAAYLLAAGSLFGALKANSKRAHTFYRLPQALAIFALVAHLLHIGVLASASGSLGFNLASMVLVVSAIVVVIFLFGCARMQIHSLGCLLFPLTALCLTLSVFWDGSASHLSARPIFPISAFSMHVLVAVLAYSFLTIATVQSLLYGYQEWRVRGHTKVAELGGLPPLQTMEQLLFRLVWIGFSLLTATLLSGAFFSQQIFDQPFVFQHHMVLAALGWLVFAALLFKRANSGIRGKTATMVTVTGFILIQLGYFGTKFVNEILLQ